MIHRHCVSLVFVDLLVVVIRCTNPRVLKFSCLLLEVRHAQLVAVVAPPSCPSMSLYRTGLASPASDLDIAQRHTIRLRFAPSRNSENAMRPAFGVASVSESCVPLTVEGLHD